MITTDGCISDILEAGLFARQVSEQASEGGFKEVQQAFDTIKSYRENRVLAHRMAAAQNAHSAAHGATFIHTHTHTHTHAHTHTHTHTFDTGAGGAHGHNRTLVRDVVVLLCSAAPLTFENFFQPPRSMYAQPHMETTPSRMPQDPRQMPHVNISSPRTGPLPNVTANTHNTHTHHTHTHTHTHDNVTRCNRGGLRQSVYVLANASPQPRPRRIRMHF